MGPRFGLPTVKQTLRALFPGHFQCDLDMGEQFLNYPLHTDLREYSGVDVSEVRSSNPANATTGKPTGDLDLGRDGKGIGWACGIHCIAACSGRCTWCLNNPFLWDRVVFNLTGSKGYWSDLPRVMKLRSDGHLATEIFVYVNNGRAASHSPEVTWKAAKAYGSGCSRWGI